VTGLPWFFMIHLIFGGYMFLPCVQDRMYLLEKLLAEGEENAEEDSTETESTDSNE